MWNSMKSVRLSCICTKLVMALVVASALALPKLMDFYVNYYTGYYTLPPENVAPLTVILYLCCVPAMAALICLDRLLTNIRGGQVFVEKNVSLLRIISWCCFLAAAILAVATKFYLLFSVMAVVLAFIGLILRVVKNVIQQACEIKAENDFTI